MPLLLGEGCLLCLGDPGAGYWLFALPMAVATPTLATLECIKFCFGGFERDNQRDDVFEEGLQFRLAHLFTTTTPFAVILGVGRLLYPFIENDNGAYSIPFMFCTIAVVFSANTLLSVWALLGNTLGIRLVILLLLSTSTSAAGTYLAARPSVIGLWIGFFAIAFVITTIHLALLRRAGVRFVRKPRIRE